MANLTNFLNAQKSKIYAVKWAPITPEKCLLVDGAESNPYPAPKEFCEMYPRLQIVLDTKYNKLQAKAVTDNGVNYFDVSINSDLMEGEVVDTKDVKILELGRGEGPYDINNKSTWCMRIE